MKIAIVGPAYPLRGGIANFNEAFAKALQDEGHQVRLFSFSLQYPNFLFPGKTQYDEGPAPADLDIFTGINSIQPTTWGKTAKQIRSFAPDFVVIRYWLPFMGPALGTIAKKLKRSGFPVIAITDNVIPHESRPGDRAFTKYFVKHCDGFIAMSRSVLSDLEQFTSNAHKRFLPHPLYNIFGEALTKHEARQLLGWNSDERIVLFFGLVRKYKGLDLLIEAFADQRVRATGAKLVVAGEFYDDETEYRNQISRLKLEDQVIIHNQYIASEEVKQYFCACDITAQTYRTATQSGVTQIAYHFERPMLVTDVGGLAEIVPHGKVGYSTPVDVQAIADSLVDFYTNDREDAFVLNVKEEKKRFEWSAFVQGTLELYQSLKS